MLALNFQSSWRILPPPYISSAQHPIIGSVGLGAFCIWRFGRDIEQIFELLTKAVGIQEIPPCDHRFFGVLFEKSGVGTKNIPSEKPLLYILEKLMKNDEYMSFFDWTSCFTASGGTTRSILRKFEVLIDEWVIHPTANVVGWLVLMGLAVLVLQLGRRSDWIVHPSIK